MTRTSDVKILIVEDEALVALALAHTIEDMGAEVVGPAHGVEEGVNLVQTKEIDFALVDFNLRDTQSIPIATELRQRDIPFVFLSGYGRQHIPSEFKDVNLLQKPCDPEDIRKAILETLPEAKLMKV